MGEIVYNFGHFDVYINGMFFCSSDTEAEARMELEEAIG